MLRSLVELAREGVREEGAAAEDEEERAASVYQTARDLWRARRALPSGAGSDAGGGPGEGEEESASGAAAGPGAPGEGPAGRLRGSMRGLGRRPGPDPRAETPQSVERHGA